MPHQNTNSPQMETLDEKGLKDRALGFMFLGERVSPARDRPSGQEQRGAPSIQ